MCNTYGKIKLGLKLNLGHKILNLYIISRYSGGRAQELQNSVQQPVLSL